MDVYESDVMKFLMKYSKNNVFDPEYIKSLAQKYKSSKDKLKKLKDELDKIMEYPRYSSKVVNAFLETRGKKIIIALLVISILLAVFLYFIPKYSQTFNEVFYLSIVFVVQNIILALTPTSLFGRWKANYYKEKLEWDAFKNFLSNLAMIKKYSPEDISIWKDWLIYGTALGVGDKVVEAMKSLNLSELVADYVIIHSNYDSMKTSVDSVYSSTTGSGGGFGAGGGFGGGGGGAR